jgi:hypothetical protein
MQEGRVGIVVLEGGNPSALPSDGAFHGDASPR